MCCDVCSKDLGVFYYFKDWIDVYLEDEEKYENFDDKHNCDYGFREFVETFILPKLNTFNKYENQQISEDTFINYLENIYEKLID